MKLLTIAAAIVALLATTQVQAAGTSAKEKCLSGVNVIEEMKEDDDTPDISEKSTEKVDRLVEVATHLCEQGNFKYAEDLVAIARGMLASE